MLNFTPKLVLLLFLCQIGFAQSTGKISGKVLEPSGTPAIYTTIILKEAADSSMIKGEITNEDGNFTLEEIPFGNYFITVSYVGFAEYNSDKFDLNKADQEIEPITLSEMSSELAEVVVTARRPLLEMKPDRMVLNVEGTINSSGNNALELMRKSPGVVVDNNENINLLGKSGVMIYIDGKPSPLSGDDLAAYLKSVQSDQIDAIEIITNPSAKYDAQGNAGIINIRMKKDKRLGSNTNLNLTYAVGETYQFNGSINANYRNKKINLFGTYGYGQGTNLNWMEFDRQINGLGFFNDTRIDNDNDGMNGKIGMDYFINDKNTIGFLAEVRTNEWSAFNTGLTDFYTQPRTGNEADSVLISINDPVNLNNNYNFNLNYQYDVKDGAKVNVDLDYGIYRGSSETNQSNVYKDTYNGTDKFSILNRNDATTDIDILTGKIDYERKLFGGQFGIGYKSSFVRTDNDFDWLNENENIYTIDLDRSNQFIYDEYVNAGYINYNGQLKKVSYQLGLRGEQTNSKGELLAFQDVNDKIVKRSYFDLFPSVSLSYGLNQNHNFSLSYSRRINRPSYQDLNPFLFQLDQLTVEQGNPFLRPEYTNNYQLRHSFKYRFNTTISYSKTKDVIARLLDSNPKDPRGSLFGYRNVSTQNQYSINFAAPVDVTKWWSSFVSLTGFRMENKAEYIDTFAVNTPSEFIDTVNLDLSVNSFNIYSSQTFKLPYKLSFEVSGWYNSAGIWEGNFASNDMWSIDLGLQKKIFKDKGKIKVSVSDVFKTAVWDGITDYNGLYMTGTGGWDSRRLKINFSYLFGNEGVKSRNRKTGLEAEQKRIKSE